MVVVFVVVALCVTGWVAMRHGGNVWVFGTGIQLVLISDFGT